ncbi:MAG TPA: hypothetical protein VFP34_13740, partial [Microlunatus sp.]|nr:hypothetical protein [Microlunatus sp.]
GTSVCCLGWSTANPSASAAAAYRARCAAAAAVRRPRWAFAVICWRCQLRDQLNDLLAGPEGVILEALLGLPQPRIAYVWIRRNAAVQTTLRRLAVGDVPLDHTAFDQLPGRTTEYLRGLLVEHGCLPSRDRYLAAFENWLPSKLDQLADPSARRHIDAFARWHLLRQLRDRAKREPIPAGAFLNAKHPPPSRSTSSTG